MHSNRTVRSNGLYRQRSHPISDTEQLQRMARVSVSQIFNALVEIGRQYPDRPESGDRIDGLEGHCHDLVSAHGEASGTAQSRVIVDEYQELENELIR